jgi:DNA-binding MarR family transcriptional regulator
MSSIEHGGGNLGYLIRRAQQAFRARMDDGLRPLGITAPQYSVLSSLSIEPGISNAELARVASVTPQSMQGIVANLEKLKLVARVASPDHGRILESRLTDQGKAVLAKAHRIARAIEETMQGDAGEREVAAFRRLLDRFTQNLEA